MKSEVKGTATSKRLGNTALDSTNGHDRTITVIFAKHCINFPDDGSLVIRNMLEQF